MNLSQKQMDAKKAYLDKQQEKMLAQYENVDSKERSEIIGHINSFIETCTKDQKRFWLSFKYKLERLNEKQGNKALFPLGQVVLTHGAIEALKESMQIPNEFLQKHQTGDYGTVCEDDWKENEFSIKNGFRLLSAYETTKQVKIWIITEADRSATTILLPSEY